MVTARSRVLVLVGALSALVGLGELACRQLPTLATAVGNRVELKMAALEAKGRAEVLVFGTSRSNDCVSAQQLAPTGSNLAIPSASMELLQTIVARSHATPGLKLVLLEVSKPQFSAVREGLEPVVAEGGAPSDLVGEWLATHSALLRERRAFAVENWPRLVVLAWPNQFDGSELLRTRWLSEVFRAVPPESPSDLAVAPSAGDVAEARADELERLAQGYAAVVESFSAPGVKVVMFGTPVMGVGRDEECTAASRGLRAAIAAQVHAPLLDFTCSEVPEEWLADGREHCGVLGRTRLTALLARAIDAVP